MLLQDIGIGFKFACKLVKSQNNRQIQTFVNYNLYRHKVAILVYSQSEAGMLLIPNGTCCIEYEVKKIINFNPLYSCFDIISLAPIYF